MNENSFTKVNAIHMKAKWFHFRIIYSIMTQRQVGC